MPVRAVYGYIDSVPLFTGPTRGGPSVWLSPAAKIHLAVDHAVTVQRRGLLLAVLGAAVAATLVNVAGSVLTRRRDLGRRRALGATRGLVVLTVVGQQAVLSVAGVAVGLPIGLAWLAAESSPLPPPTFTAAVGVALVAASLLAAALPAVYAATRDPLIDLRQA